MAESDTSQYEATLQSVVAYIIEKVSEDERLKDALQAGNVEDIEQEVRSFLEDNAEKDIVAFDVTHLSMSYLLDVLAEALAKSNAAKAEALEACISLLNSVYRADERVQQFLADFTALAAPEEVEENAGLAASGDDIHTASLEKLLMSKEQAAEVQQAWYMFLEGYAEDAAADAVFNAFYEASPSLQHLFKTSRAVLAGRFFRGVQQLILSLHDGAETKALVEVMGFRHMDLEVTSARISCFREAFLDLMQSELGERFNTFAYDGLRRMFNYVGGGYIYVRENFKDRLEIIASSWAIANSDGQDEMNDTDTVEGEKAQATQENQETQDATKSATKLLQQSVPTSFQDMFCFNAAVMGLEDREWMYEILKSFDAIVRNVSNSYRLQEECDVISLRFAKVSTNVQLSEFKALMLASLRSLVPKGWDSNHESAWVWLWSNVESILQKELGKAGPRARLVGRYVGSMEAHSKEELSGMIYKKFFALAPEGQNYFKQSSSRLLFIVHQIFQITVDMYADPVLSVEQISALGLRHVGYGIPTEFFSPFVSCVIEALKEFTQDEKLCDAFAWSLGLVSRILVRTITEGSTLVMKAINMNSGKHVKRALITVSRKRRAMAMLKVTVGTQSISPLLWAIQSGSIEAAKAIIEDLLTIRADRDRYYYAVNELFERHPDFVKVITTEAPSLLQVLVDRLVWRSRVVVAGHRRVNLYIEHLVIDSEGKFADALEWIRKLANPTIVKHVLLEKLTDLVWDKVIYQPFLRSKVWLLFSLLVFLFSQSILKSMMHSGSLDYYGARVATFACRCFVYLGSLTELIYTQTKVVYKAIKSGDLTRFLQIPIPKKYRNDWREAVSLVLALVLISMLWVEPILYCLQSWEGDFEGAGEFTSECPNAVDVQDFYSLLSMCGMFCYFFLLVDFSAVFVRLSAFVLMAARTLPELLLSLVASLFFVVVFSSGVTVFRGEVADMQNVLVAMMTFFQISVGLYPKSKFKDLESSRWLLVMCMGFLFLVVLFLFNLLIAQLIGVYRKVHRTVVGLARLNRIAIICDSMPSVRQKVWRRFVTSLELEKPMEFAEGDTGLPGGIQILEAANVCPTYDDTIHRYGGSTSPQMPWPEDEEAPTNSLEDRLDSITKIFKKAVKRMNMNEKKKRGSNSSASSGSSSISSLSSGGGSE